MQRVYVVGTADTKGEELDFLARSVRTSGCEACVVDIGILTPTIKPDVSALEVASVTDPELLKLRDRGAAVSAMAKAFSKYIADCDDVAGIVGIGGGGGTSIVTAGMRALPVGLPKLMVSTLASGDTSPYVGASDIIMMPSITDLAGLNRISRVVLTNAAAAIAAMSRNIPDFAADKPAIGLTTFGVTTKAVTQILDGLDDGIEGVPFHATGTGGRTMESLVSSGMLNAVIDVTTTEIADMLFGGVMPSTADRLDCIAETKVPYIGSLGACDMINFWAPSTVPDQHADRLFYHHNDNVTLMRTSAHECAEIGKWIGTKLNECEGEIDFIIPEHGISALDIVGGPFYDPAADQALFNAVINTTNWTDRRRLIRLPAHINDPEFAEVVIQALSKSNILRT